MSKEKILIVDDDKNVCELLKNCLEKEDYSTIISHDGNEALVKFKSLSPDFIILAIMISGMDGWQVCKEIRRIADTPIIILTAKSEVCDKVLGLELGADDYIVKPFDPKEVIARIRAVSRRCAKNPQTDPPAEVNYDKLSINLTRYVLMVDGKVIDTPPKEIELLYCLASQPNTLMSRNQLLDSVWGYDYYGDSRTIDVHIKRLRDKIEGVSDQWELATVWGRGYKFTLKENKNDTEDTEKNG